MLLRQALGAGAAALLVVLLLLLRNSALAVLVAVMLVITLLSAVLPRTAPVVRLGLAVALVAAAAFGALAPWLICSWGPPYDRELCPLDQCKRCELQRQRVKWGCAAAAVAVVLAGWGIISAWAVSRTRFLIRLLSAVKRLRRELRGVGVEEPPHL